MSGPLSGRKNARMKLAITARRNVVVGCRGERNPSNKEVAETKMDDITNRKGRKPRSLSKVLVVSALYAVLMGGAAYFTYKLLVEPVRQRDPPSIPKRTQVLPDPRSTLSTALIPPAPRG